MDRTIASSVAVGGISALNYAGRLNLFIQGLFVSSIITVIYPMISAYAAKQDFKAIKKSLRDSINMIMLFVFPLMVGSMVFSTEIVSLLFGRGAFGLEAIQMTSTALFYYSLGMLAFGLREIVSRVFYAWQDTKTPMINAALGMVLNIILNIILSRYMGIGGLALATSISAIFTTILLFISLRNKIGPFGMKQIIISFIKILFASAFMGIFAKISFGYLHSMIGSNLALMMAIIVGGISYIGVIYFMKIEEVDIIKNIVKDKLRKN